ncbi:MerR family transcriptional regulator [Shewanella morhuae]|uniref:HTH-type transcriptional repressor YcgE n=1 Tax=Shewanella morhuae TaxID=365591 RepID=A0A380A8R3_9GAMM|nr:MerR family transcriptional regulator [Shewanella morhuae]SUI76336.1 HTH-type transcriptional repressor YcgE [Shewanella morhuae]
MKQIITSASDIESNGDALLPIGEVSVLTGVNAVTLRAWQRRFGLVIPARTPKGHRLYTRDNIEQIYEINTWLAKGVAISKVKPLLNSAAKSSNEQLQNQAVDSWGEQIIALTTALFDFNQHKLQQILDEAIGLYPFVLVKEKLLQPWLNQLEDLVAERLDADLIIAWLKSELLSRIGGRPAFAGQTVSARVAVINLTHGALTPLNSTRSKTLYSLLLLLELAALRASVIDLGNQTIASVSLLSNRLNLDALLLLPEPNHSGTEQAEMQAVLAQMTFPCRFVGPFAPTLTSLSAFYTSSIADLIGQVSARSTSKARKSIKHTEKIAAVSHSEHHNARKNHDIS